MTSDPALHRPRRWAVLAAYTLVAGVSQMLWLNFAPLLGLVQNRYGVSEEVAGLLVGVFPLLYVVLSIPAGALTDSRGYRVTVGAGAIGMAIAAGVRILDHDFWFLLAGQIGVAIAQPFVGNGISKLVADWFADEQGALATGLGTVGMFAGMAVGLAATPALVAASDLGTAMTVCAAITAAAALLFWLVVTPNRAAAAVVADGPRFRPLLARRGLRILLVLAFLGLGVFNGLTTWLEPILAVRGIDAERAGLVGGALIVGGIAGAIVVPALSDAASRRKPFLIACAASGLALIWPLCTTGHFGALLGLAGLLGFLFLPAYALLLEMSGQLAGPAAAGAATSLLMLAGNAGGVAVVVAMPLVKGNAPDYQPAILLLVVLLAITVSLALLAPETSAAAAPGSPADRRG
jgi:predicted MFS family arabinose efflux permease